MVFLPSSGMPEQTHQGQGQGIGGVGRRNSGFSFQKMPDRLFNLCLGGVAVSGEDRFYLFCRNFYRFNATLSASQQDDTADLAEGNARFWIGPQGKDVFKDHQVRFFRVENGTKLGKNMVKSGGQGLGLGSSDGAEGKPSYAGADSLNDSKSGMSQAGIYADDLDWRFQGSCLVFTDH